MGFWTSFFEPKYYGLLQASVMNVFPLKDRNANRGVIREMLKEIRNFRNNKVKNIYSIRMD